MARGTLTHQHIERTLETLAFLAGVREQLARIEPADLAAIQRVRGMVDRTAEILGPHMAATPEAA